MSHQRIIFLLVAGFAFTAPYAAAQGVSKPITADELVAILQRQAAQVIAARNLTPGYWLMDGDMQMPLSFNPTTDGFYATNLWPGGIVPFTLAGGFSSQDLNNIIGAMFTWQNLANITFVARQVQVDYIYIQPSNGNSSAVGRSGGQQIINFAAGQSNGVYVHELGHCLGLLHEQQRTDRDFSIQIIQANVQQPFYGANFPIVGSGAVWGPYDFASIMHYDRCAFAIGCLPSQTCNCTVSQETMQVLGANNAIWQSVIGTANAPSYRDGITMRGLYPVASDRWNTDISAGTHDGSFQNPWNLNVAVAAAQTPTGGTLYLKNNTIYHGIGTYSNAVTIVSPAGSAVLGN